MRNDNNVLGSLSTTPNSNTLTEMSAIQCRTQFSLVDTLLIESWNTCLCALTSQVAQAIFRARTQLLWEAVSVRLLGAVRRKKTCKKTWHASMKQCAFKLPALKFAVVAVRLV